MTLNISGISIEVHKKEIKNMHLYVKPPDGKVSVSAPVSMSDDAIERFVRTKIRWIKTQVANFDNQLRQSEREHVSGESLYVWGKQYIVQIEYSNRYAIELVGDKAIFTVRKGSNSEQRENFLREWYRELLKKEVTRLLPKWENFTGLKPTSWQIKYMTTRWGTCNTDTGKLWFNLQLAKKSIECLEYIILHEMLHLVERTHNERFILLLDQYMPMWREIRVKLNGQVLDFME